MFTEFTSIKDLKSSLKEQSAQIKSQKNKARVLKLEGNGPEANSIHNHLAFYESIEFRICHIAYCELRGKTRDQIENKTNTPQYWLSYINTKVEQIKISIENSIESVRYNAI